MLIMFYKHANMLAHIITLVIGFVAKDNKLLSFFNFEEYITIMKSGICIYPSFFILIFICILKGRIQIIICIIVNIPSLH